MRIGQLITTGEVISDPNSLSLREWHHCAERLEQTDKEEIRDVRAEDSPVEIDLVVWR